MSPRARPVPVFLRGPGDSTRRSVRSLLFRRSRDTITLVCRPSVHLRAHPRSDRVTCDREA
eukprot:358619-Chlamydomonas_euryale.AAC.17